jgi:abortive infection bacteriophage resistance protein
MSWLQNALAFVGKIDNKLDNQFLHSLYVKDKFGMKNTQVWNEKHRRTHTNAVNSILPKIQLYTFPGKIGGVIPVSLKTQSFLDKTYTYTFN